jgi:hypothetical protein
MITCIVNPDTTNKKEKEDEPDSIKTEKTKNDSVTVEIVNEGGKIIRTLKEKVEPGLNRIYWNYDRKGVRWPNTPKPEKEHEYGGPTVLPGKYKVKVSFAEYADSTNVVVKTDPRIIFSIDNLKAKSDYLDKILDRVKIATKAADQIREAEKTVALITGRMKDKSGAEIDSLNKKSKVIKDSLKALLELINQPEVQGIRDNPNTLSARLSAVNEYVSSSFEAPGSTADAALLLADKKLKSAIRRVNNFFETNWKDYKNDVKDAGVSFFDEYELLEY